VRGDDWVLDLAGGDDGVQVPQDRRSGVAAAAPSFRDTPI
jgi:hypothetical protein